MSGRDITTGDEPMPTDENAPLTDACGHHCGAQQVGSVTRTAHCGCGECHNTPAPWSA